MGYTREALSGTQGRISSKRFSGMSCIAFSMILSIISYFKGDGDIPPNVVIVSLQFLLSGVGLLGAGLLEKPKNEKTEN
jgi:hypothetical protein